MYETLGLCHSSSYCSIHLLCYHTEMLSILCKNVAFALAIGMPLLKGDVDLLFLALSTILSLPSFGELLNYVTQLHIEKNRALSIEYKI